MRVTNFGIQLREKQKARRIYGILERQFRSYFKEAAKLPGVTGENLLQILETRLDNMVYRLGFASSRPLARQLVLHGHFEVNGRKVNIPSCRIRPGDVVSVKESARTMVPIEHAVETRGGRNLPDWLQANTKTMQGRLLNLPTREAIPVTIQENLIVELYSK